MSYISNQAIGQLSLELSAEDNQSVLNSSKYKKEEKDKIRKIISYKKYFYNYFKKKPTSIYDETSFLKDDAVTYLVISSAFNKVEAVRVDFPIVGSFPYLGFFDKEDALEYKKEQSKKNFYTYLRPVYAYSTLNKLFFKDNILSSFFRYSDVDLAELIFHELTHTIFFVKNNVSFNESLADFIARELMLEYFKLSSVDAVKIKKKRLKGKALYKEINRLSLMYKKQVNELKPANKKIADKQLKSFLKEKFYPLIKRKCSALNKKVCWPALVKWNNARFAAFLTYSEKQNIVGRVKEAKSLTLKQLLIYLEKAYERFENSENKDFSLFLEGELKK